ncbi:2328_t:CDS:2, partial [Gigaspora rosea]
YVEVDWDPHSKCLRRLFYMSPDQIERWLKFGDVILNNNTAATNSYEMALTNDETKKAHAWILQQIKKATFEATPHVIFTDADPALIATIQDEFSTTHALNCMFHITQNLPLNLKSTLKDRYDEFIKDFFEARQSSFIAIFEYRWECLFEKYNPGMSSTSQVESYNAKIKRLIFNSNTTLLELAEKLSVCILKEDKKTEYALFRASIPKTVLTVTADTILLNALQYHGIKIEKDVMQRFVAVDPNLFGENSNFTNITTKLILEFVDKNKIVEMWRVRQITSNEIKKTIFGCAKFEIEQSITMGWNSPVPYLNVLVKEQFREMITSLSLFLININDRQEPLSDSDIDSSDSSNEDKTEIDNERLDPSELMDPHKCKGKGRPKGTNRIRCAGEPSKKTKRKLHCKICGGAGHNR